MTFLAWYLPSIKEGGKYEGSRYKLNSDNYCITIFGHSYCFTTVAEK